MREYEVTIVLKPDLEEETRKELLGRIAGWLTHGAGEQDRPVANHWGQRTLAYPIKKANEGYYVVYDARLEPARVGEVERNFLYGEDILRHLVVRKDRR